MRYDRQSLEIRLLLGDVIGYTDRREVMKIYT